MPAAIVRLNGMLSQGRDNSCTVSFEGPTIQLATLLKILKAEVPSKAVAFCAINGSKVTSEALIKNGDIVDIFPVVAGG